MAKQVGPIKLTRTICNICFYKAGGNYYARQVHRHNSKKVKTSPRFALTMIHARILGRASKIASKVYRDLPRDFRQFWMYHAFTGEAMQMLKLNKTDEETLKTLWHTYASIHHMQVTEVSTRPTGIKIKKETVVKMQNSSQSLAEKVRSKNLTVLASLQDFKSSPLSSLASGGNSS